MEIEPQMKYKGTTHFSVSKLKQKMSIVEVIFFLLHFSFQNRFLSKI